MNVHSDPSLHLAQMSQDTFSCAAAYLPLLDSWYILMVDLLGVNFYNLHKATEVLFCLD